MKDGQTALWNNPPMFHIVWEFRVKPEYWSIFREEYAPQGIWGQLFRNARGYLGTTLLIDQSQPRRAVTIDRWEREEDFSEFKKTFADEYKALDLRCEAYTESETLIGRFTDR